MSDTFTVSNINLTLDGTASYANNSVSSAFAQNSLSSSWSPNQGATTLVTGSTYLITSSWATNTINGGTQLTTGSTYQITSSNSISASWAPSIGASTAYTFPTFISKIYTFRSNGFGSNSTIENGELGYTGQVNGDGNTVYVASGTPSSSLYLVKNININTVTSFQSNNTYFYPHTNGSGQYWANYKETGHVGLFTGVGVINSGIYFKTGYSGFSSPTAYFPLTWSAVVCDSGIETQVSTTYSSSVNSVLNWTYINNTASFYINGTNVATINKAIVSGYNCQNLLDVTGVYTPDQTSTLGCSLIRFNYLT